MNNIFSFYDTPVTRNHDDYEDPLARLPANIQSNLYYIWLPNIPQIPNVGYIFMVTYKSRVYFLIFFFFFTKYKIKRENRVQKEKEMNNITTIINKWKKSNIYNDSVYQTKMTHKWLKRKKKPAKYGLWVYDVHSILVHTHKPKCYSILYRQKCRKNAHV